MNTIHIDDRELWPECFKNWIKENVQSPWEWVQLTTRFQETTGGNIVGDDGAVDFYLVFNNEQDCLCFLLRWS
jgi:hypothetical protein